MCITIYFMFVKLLVNKRTMEVVPAEESYYSQNMRIYFYYLLGLGLKYLLFFNVVCILVKLSR